MTTGICPFAAWRPLPEHGRQAAIVPTQAIWHSAVDHPGPTNLHGYFARGDVGLESHFWIRIDGTLEQFMSIYERADANLHANRRPDGTGAVSIETEDEGDPDQRPWTRPQLATMRRLALWLHDTADIPLTQCRTPAAPGQGYHVLFGAPGPWTNVTGKTCPGRARIAQWPAFLESLATPDPAEDPMPTADEIRVIVRDELRATRTADAAAKTLGAHDAALVEILADARTNGPTHARILAAVGETDAAVAMLVQALDAALAGEGAVVDGEVVERAVRRVFADAAGQS